MKLRNSFITAVFFSAGITFAFAEAPVDEDTFRETTYTFESFSSADKLNAYALSFFQTSENNGGDSVQSEQNGITGTGSERNDYTIGYKNNGTSPSFHANSTSAAPDGNETLSLYDLSNSFYDSVTEEIGFTARGERENPLVFSDFIPSAPNDSQLPNQEIFSMLSYDKNVFTNAQNWGQILLGGYYYEPKEEENIFLLFGSMITVPFAILSFTLGIGFLLIIFTSIWNKENV